jgi:hypothetical protein
MPLDLEEPGGDGIFPCAFPSPAAGGCPGKPAETDGARDPGDRCGWSHALTPVASSPHPHHAASPTRVARRTCRGVAAPPRGCPSPPGTTLEDLPEDALLCILVLLAPPDATAAACYRLASAASSPSLPPTLALRLGLPCPSPPQPAGSSAPSTASLLLGARRAQLASFVRPHRTRGQGASDVQSMVVRASRLPGSPQPQAHQIFTSPSVDAT